MVLVDKEFVMCNKNLRLKSPLKVNRQLEFIEAPWSLTLLCFEEGGGPGPIVLNLTFRRVGWQKF